MPNVISNPFFQVRPDDILHLDSTQLVQLSRHLLLAEARKAGLRLRAVHVPLQITIPDGGEDCRILWEGGEPATDFLPARFCILQAKAGKLTTDGYRKEVWAQKRLKKGQRPRLNRAVSDVLEKRGAYIVLTTSVLTGEDIDQRRQKIREGITECGADPSLAAEIDVYDANRLSDWVNSHPTVAVWLNSTIKGLPLGGLQSFESWGKSHDLANTPWADDDKPRFTLISDDPSNSTLSFSHLVGAINSHLTEAKSSLRVVGAPGTGKSRAIHQTFKQVQSIADAIDQGAIIFADYTIVGDQLLAAALALAESQAVCILIIDECPHAVHMELRGLVERQGSQLRLLTIAAEGAIHGNPPQMTIRVERAKNSLVEAMAKAGDHALTGMDVHYVAQLADGFPRMAVLAIEALGRDGDPLRSVDSLLDRIVWGKREPNDEAARAIQAASLFDVIKVAGEETDYEFIAVELADMAPARFYEHIMRFKDDRGIVSQRGRFIQVQPLPLAARLAAKRLTQLPPGHLIKVFLKSSEALNQRLLDRLIWLDDSPHAKEFATSLLDSGALGNLAALNTRFGAKCLNRLVHIHPRCALKTIENVLDTASDEELAAVGPGRRNLVWALERLVFSAEYFEPAARVLRRLATNESESNIGNNASGQFIHLYQLRLSGTEASPAPRLRVVDDGLASANLNERTVCVHALGKMLENAHFSRHGGAETLGSGPPRRDWQPSTWAEVFDFYRTALSRLKVIATTPGDPLAPLARNKIAHNIRGLLVPVLFDDVAGVVREVHATIGYWPEVLASINDWLYFDGREAPTDFTAKVRAFYDELLPQDILDLAHLYTHAWQVAFHDPDTCYEPSTTGNHDWSIQQCQTLARQIAQDMFLVQACLDRMVGQVLHSGWYFGHALAENLQNPVAVFEQMLERAENLERPVDGRLFRGFITGCEAVNPETAQKCIALGLKCEALKSEWVELLAAKTLADGDVDQIIKLLKDRTIKASNCMTLAYGRRLDDLSSANLLRLMDALAADGPEGMASALEIAHMFLFGKPEKPVDLLVWVKSRLLEGSVLAAVGRRDQDAFRLQQFSRLLLQANLINEPDTYQVTRQMLGLCLADDHNRLFRFERTVRGILRDLIGLHPTAVWEAFTLTLSSITTVQAFWIKHLVQPNEHDAEPGTEDEGGVLFRLPQHLYVDWARTDLANRLPFVMSWVPVLQKRDEKITWHPIIEFLASEFRGDDAMLDRLALRMHPTSWVGSVIPHAQPFLPLLADWFNHPVAAVRTWARKEHYALEEYISKNQEREDEKELGIW